MPVIIHDLDIDLTDESQESRNDAPADQAPPPRPLTPLDLQDVWQRYSDRSHRVRAH